jgi:prephenate dehydrogenase
MTWFAVGYCLAAAPSRRLHSRGPLHEGCRIVEIGCAEHDVHAAETQLLTHTIGGMLALHHLHAK